jgi:hypothetical protein
LITGGMNAPSEGKPNTTMVIFGGPCAAAGADIANAMSVSAAMMLNADRRIFVILFLLQVAVQFGGPLAFILLSNSE